MHGFTRGKRSAVTCHLKCADACAQPVPNTSDNEYFADVAGAALSRRSVLGGGAVGALALLVAGAAGAAPAAAAGRGRARGAGLAFSPIAPVPATVDALTVPAGYRWAPIIRWGDPILRGAPEFDAANQTAAAQAGQFGYNNDYLDIISMNRQRGVTGGVHHAGTAPRTRDHKAVLVANHEYTNETIMFPPTDDPATVSEQRRIAMAAHGMSVVEVRRRGVGQPWEYQRRSPHNRRLTVSTPFTVTGPAAGSSLLTTGADPTGRTVLGTLNNCAGGTTPWGTVLSGEENFNGYFRTSGTGRGDARYGLRDRETARGWEHEDPRFDARNPGYENEPHRFGWVVELDPFEPDSAPQKHTALGRFKHEAANIVVAPSGHVAAYMGDDERFDYLYKFVSRDTMRTGTRRADRAHNKTLLSHGSLFVARFHGDSPAAEIDGSGALPADGAFDGTGEWLPLMVDGVSVVPGFGAEEVAVFTRLAADAVGATKMDRPEDVEASPTTGRVYMACTNNTDRGKPGTQGATEPNPRVLNRNGHVVEITETGDDPTAATFTWTLLLVCGDPTTDGSAYFAGFPADRVSPISCPDNLAFDDSGNLWISTDGQPGTIGYNDALHRVPLEGPERGHVQQFLAVPTEAETCGPVIDEAESMVYVSVQHPGEDGSFTDQHSRFPDYAPSTGAGRGRFAGPRPSVVQVWRG
ncbi:PhoX family phosphatase [uncultured Cellulomonas sp.]|uniref:PhoX family protein n=1 Tax=uncultured Cellulomonas sp. TaxID=189682 RepID=UPI00261FE1B3|nr:PhoX family phosphatase [uncultured Cellulomonas sp.]